MIVGKNLGSGKKSKNVCSGKHFLGFSGQWWKTDGVIRQPLQTASNKKSYDGAHDYKQELKSSYRYSERSETDTCHNMKQKDYHKPGYWKDWYWNKGGREKVNLSKKVNQVLNQIEKSKVSLNS